MSTAPLTHDVAYSTLYDKILAPAFFAKLASYGLQPNTIEDAQQLLAIGHQLMQQEQLVAAKQAAATGTFFAKAAGALNEALGVPPAYYSAADDQWIKQATAGYLNDPDVVAAAGAMHAAAIAAAG